MKRILIILTLVVLLVSSCTQIQTEDTEKTGDESTDNLEDYISNFDNLDSDLNELDDFNLNDLDF